ncbi:hypothetical protein BST61_g6992 [Cercospora zeina]
MRAAVALAHQRLPSSPLKPRHKPLPSSFRFLKLPAEIRNRLYSYYFATGENDEPQYNLVNYRDPPITLVCKQIRLEALPIFFSECRFLLTIGANYFEPERKSQAGKLCFDPTGCASRALSGGVWYFRSLWSDT